MDRIEELRKMVTDIATEIGLDASDLLQGEVDAMGKRLENVRESISVLADIADARISNADECSKNIDDVKADLKEMKTVGYHSSIICFCTFEERKNQFSIFLCNSNRQ